MITLGLTEIHISGDCNMNILDRSAASTKSLTHFLYAFNLKQYISEPTRTTDTSVTCVDIYMCNREEIVQSSGVVAIGSSDHDMVYVHRKLAHKKAKASFIKARLFSNFDEKLFLTGIESLAFNDVYMTTDPDAAWGHFKTELLDICDAMAPYGSIRIRGCLPEWMTKEFS